MELLRRCENFDHQGYQPYATPGQGGTKLLRFGILRLRSGDSYSAQNDDFETGLVILGGKCDVECGEERWLAIGERENVFAGPAYGLYLPSGSSYKIRAVIDVEIAVCEAPGMKGKKPVLVTPNEVRINHIGRGNWQREVHDIILENVDAEHLIIGETFNPPGNWSSYPPHKHDVENPPEEVELEEVYYFRVNPPNGFGLQRIYNKSGVEHVYTIRDRDFVIIPSGYHPVAAAPGYRVYYLWALAGKGRLMRPNDDLDHVWVKKAQGSHLLVSNGKGDEP